MSVDSLQAAILDEAQAQAHEIEQTNARELERLESALKEKLTKLEDRIVSAAEAVGQREARRLTQEAHLEAKADILRAKQEELTLTLQAVMETVLGWDRKATEQLLEALFDQLTDTDGEVVAGAHHKDLVTALAKKSGLRVADETIDDDGGFIVRNAHGEVDMRLSHMVQHMFARYRADIARHLFNGSVQ